MLSDDLLPPCSLAAHWQTNNDTQKPHATMGHAAAHLFACIRGRSGKILCKNPIIAR